MQGFEGGEAVIGLAGEEFTQFFSFDEFGDDDDDFSSFDVGCFLVVVLHQDRAVAEGVELSGVSDRGFA